MGPRPPKPSSRASQNSSVPSWWSQPIIVISIPRVPSLSFFFSISGFYDTPVNKIRAFFVISSILRDCGGLSCTGRGSLCFSVGFSGGLLGPGLHPLDLLGAHPLPAGKSGFVRNLDTAGKAPVQAVPPGQLIALEHALSNLIAGTGAGRADRQGIPAAVALFFSQISSGCRSPPHTGQLAVMIFGSLRQVDCST